MISLHQNKQPGGKHPHVHALKVHGKPGACYNRRYQSEPGREQAADIQRYQGEPGKEKASCR